MNTQLTNRNYLAPTGFKMQLSNLPTVEFYCQAANIPTIEAGFPTLATPLEDIALPPDKMVFEPLKIKFLIDEDLNNFSALQNWFRGLTKPESFSQAINYLDSGLYKEPSQRYLNEVSEGTLFILDSNYNTNANIKFQSIFPISLSGLEFNVDTRDIQYFVAEAVFKYTIYNIYDAKGNKLTL